MPSHATLRPRSLPILRLPILRLAICLIGLSGLTQLPAQDPTPTPPPALAPGRYILITQHEARMDPILFTIAKNKDAYTITAEDSQFAASTITTDAGNYVFQLTRNVQDKENNLPYKEILHFAGLPPDTNPRTLQGSFTVLTLYSRPYPQLPQNSPNSTTGTFLLFPVDKAK